VKKFHIIIWVYIIGFLLNLIWEVLQAPLYEGFDLSSLHLLYCLYASVVDAFVIAIMFSGFAIYYRRLNWVNKLTIGNAVVLIISGLFVAIIFESWALIRKQWNYSSNMPILPFTKIGLSPVLQMMILPFITFYLTKKISEKKRTNKDL